MSRLPLVPEDAQDPDLKPVFDLFREQGRSVPELYRTLGNSPRLLRAWTEFAWPLRHEAQTSRGLRELMIMRVAQLTESTTEWAAHWKMAVEHGNPPEKLEQLTDWQRSDAFDDVEQAVLAFVDEVTEALDVSAETFATLEQHFTAGEIVELTLSTAFYSCVARVLRPLQIEPR